MQWYVLRVQSNKEMRVKEAELISAFELPKSLIVRTEDI